MNRRGTHSETEQPPKIKNWAGWLGLALVWLGQGPAIAAASQPDTSHQYVIVRTDTPPVLDGDIREFLTAPKIRIQLPASISGEYYLLWDDQALYGAVRCSDTQLNAETTDQDDGGIWWDDALEYLFDTGFDGWKQGPFADTDDNDYEFTLNLLNTTTENVGPQFPAADYSWDPQAITRVVLQGTLNQNQDVDTGFTMEWRIRWSDWGIPQPTTGTAWGLNLNVFDKRGDAPFIIYGGWTTNLNNSTDLPFFAGIGWFGKAQQALELSWITAVDSPLLVETSNNLVGQIHCRVQGTDRLASLRIENLGSAQAGRDLAAIKLWAQSGGGVYDPRLAQFLGTFSVVDDRTYQLVMDHPVQEGDDLYITADISADPQIGSTCRFSLPAQGAKFQLSWPREILALTNTMAQEIRRSPDFILDFTSQAPVRVIPGLQDLYVGDLAIRNLSRLDLAVESVFITVTDIAGQSQPPDRVFRSLWLEKEGHIISRLTAPFATSGLFRLASPELIPDTGQLILELHGELGTDPALSDFRAGLFNQQAVNSGREVSQAENGKAFPLLTQPIHVRDPHLTTSLSNFPNPFRPDREATRIVYYLESAARVRLEVRTLDQERVRMVDQGEKNPGWQEAVWNGGNESGHLVKSGIYLLDLEADFQGKIVRVKRKIALLR